jgi:hypothetical protein
MLLAALTLTACTDVGTGHGMIVSSPRTGRTTRPAPPKSTAPAPPADIPTETHTGKGNGEFTTDWPAGQPGYLTFDCPKCTANVFVDPDGSLPMPINAIGHYHGTVWFNVPPAGPVHTFKVTANAAWTATLADHRSVPVAELGKPVPGKSEAVLRIPAGAKSVKIQVNGQGNFSAWVTTRDSVQLVLNEIGDHETDAPVTGPAYLQVTAMDGTWTVTAT